MWPVTAADAVAIDTLPDTDLLNPLRIVTSPPLATLASPAVSAKLPPAPLPLLPTDNVTAPA
jgi:hypothetical protein